MNSLYTLRHLISHLKWWSQSKICEVSLYHIARWFELLFNLLLKEMIAQEVMSFKANKQGLLQPQPSVSLRRKERYTLADK